MQLKSIRARAHHLAHELISLLIFGITLENESLCMHVAQCCTGISG